MKILPILPSINTNSYSYPKKNNTYNKNYADSVNFGSKEKLVQELTTIPNLNIEAIMADAKVLTERLQTLIKREKDLRASIDGIFKIASDRIGTILADNGISLEHFPYYNEQHHKINSQFLSLMDELGYESVSSPMKSNRFVQEVFDIITLKSGNNPGAELKVFRTPQYDKYYKVIPDKYNFGVFSYADPEIKLTNEAFNSKYMPNYMFDLSKLKYENEELITEGEFHEFKFNFSRNNTTPISDKLNQIVYTYEPWNRIHTITSYDKNTVYNLKSVNPYPPNIIQKYPDNGMQVRYLLSEKNDYRNCTGVILTKIQ